MNGRASYIDIINLFHFKNSILVMSVVCLIGMFHGIRSLNLSDRSKSLHRNIEYVLKSCMLFHVHTLMEYGVYFSFASEKIINLFLTGILRLVLVILLF